MHFWLKKRQQFKGICKHGRLLPVNIYQLVLSYRIQFSHMGSVLDPSSELALPFWLQLFLFPKTLKCISFLRTLEIIYRLLDNPLKEWKHTKEKRKPLYIIQGYSPNIQEPYNNQFSGFFHTLTTIFMDQSAKIGFSNFFDSIYY